MWKVAREYPGEYHSRRWATTDHVVPYKMFFVMLGTLRHLEAADDMRQTQAVGLAIAQALAQKNDLKMKRTMRERVRLAYPEVEDG